MNKPTLPKPSRGILSAIAKERNISLPGVMKHYYNGRPEYVTRVIELETERSNAQRNALRAYVDHLGININGEQP